MLKTAIVTGASRGIGRIMDERSGFVTGQVLYVCGGLILARGGS